jgi:hypothetical protein
MAEVFHEDFRMIFNFPMFANPQTAFAMFSLCYSSHLSYLLHTMFPFLGFLQHYIKFNIHTITMLEKLLGVGFFSGFIDHLPCHHATLLASLSGFDLLSIV